MLYNPLTKKKGVGFSPSGLFGGNHGTGFKWGPSEWIGRNSNIGIKWAPSEWWGKNSKPSPPPFDRKTHQKNLDNLIAMAPSRQSFDVDKAKLSGKYLDVLMQNLKPVNYDRQANFDRSNQILSRLTDMANTKGPSEAAKRQMDFMASQGVQRQNTLASRSKSATDDIFRRLAESGGLSPAAKERMLKAQKRQEMFGMQNISQDLANQKLGILAQDEANKSNLLDRLAGYRLRQDTMANDQQNLNQRLAMMAASSGMSADKFNKGLVAQDIRDRNLWEQLKWKMRARGQAGIHTAEAM